VVASSHPVLRRARLRPSGLFALACATYVLAFLMISNIRYYSFKDFNFAKRHPFGVLLVAALGILIVFAHPDTSVFSCSARTRCRDRCAGSCSGSESPRRPWCCARPAHPGSGEA
jgi:hypothetical protein